MFDPELTAITEHLLDASIQEAERKWEENRELILGNLNICYQASESLLIGDSFLFWTPQQWEEYWIMKEK